MSTIRLRDVTNLLFPGDHVVLETACGLRQEGLCTTNGQIELYWPSTYMDPDAVGIVTINRQGKEIFSSRLG